MIRSPANASRWVGSTSFRIGAHAIAAAAGTDVGPRRTVNEDAVAIVPSRGACVVVDGLGSVPPLDPLVVRTEALAPGDRVVLCTDGVHASRDPAQLAARVGEPDPEVAVTRILDAIVAASGTDNATIAILAIAG